MRVQLQRGILAEHKDAADPGGPIMVRYWFAWTPLVVVSTVVLLALPWLGLITLMLVALAVLGAFAWGIVVVPHMLVRAVKRRWHPRGSTRQQAASLPTVSPSLRPTRSMPAGAAVLLANPPSDADRLT
jgi:hypothetical protein